MANIAVTSTTNTVKADFGDYYPATLKKSKGTYNKTRVDSMELYANWIEIIVEGSETWRVSHDGTDSSLIVDTVNTVAPSSLSDLYTKLSALIE